MVSGNLIQYAFTAGEVSPTLFGRTDFQKYDLGLAYAKNFFINYRGGLQSRPGTKFLDYIMHDDQETWLIKFQYAPDIAQTYVLLFGNNYVRFLQDGGYVLEDAVTITGVTKASPGVVTAAGHGYANGDWIKISGVSGLHGRTFEVANKTTNTFSLKDPFGNAFDTSDIPTYVSGGTVARIYTLVSPYAAADLSRLKTFQRKNELYITHEDYRPRKLIRNDATDWVFEELTFDNNAVGSPTNLTLTPNVGGGYAYVGTVTAIDADGNESLPSHRVIVKLDYSNWNSGNEYITWEWDPVPGASFYSLYRATLSVKEQQTGGEQVGFLAKTNGTKFNDTSQRIPDFTKAPPIVYDPFAPSSVIYIQVTAGGADYKTTDTLSMSGGGSDFAGQLVVDGTTGEIQAVIINNAGRGYTNPTLTVTSATGTGATFSVSVGPASGNYPATVAINQQRLVYAGSENFPLKIWGSYTNNFTNFSIQTPVLESNGYEFELDTEDVAPIRHILPTRGGLLVFTQSSIQLLRGTGDKSISSVNALADPQSYNGASYISPITIDTDILYVESKGSSVRLLSYNDFSKVYGGQNMSILANHLFPSGVPLVEWTYAEAPFNLVWARRDDGALLAFTIVKEQEVFAWTQCWTRGLFNNVLSVEENSLDSVYLTVDRYINGRWTRFIEQFADRNFSSVEEAWCVDCGLQLTATYPEAILTPSAKTGDITLTASASVFSADDVGKVIRGGGGKVTVTAYTSGTEVSGTVTNAFTKLISETDIPLSIASGNWTLDPVVTTVSGLWHLEGETLVGLSDGNVVEDLVVTDGSVTLPHAASRVTLGLKFTCIAQTLPPTVRDAIIEDKRKDIIGSAVRMNESRGLKVGATLDKLYAAKERTNEKWGEPTRLQNGYKTILIDANWDDNGQTYYVQEHPLPATILGLVLDLEVGDDTN